MKQFLKIIPTLILLLMGGVKEIKAQNQHPKFTFKIERKADGYYYGSMKSDLSLSRAKFETTITTNQFTLVAPLGSFAPASQTIKSPINMTNFEDLLPVIPADQGTYQWTIERTNANVGNTSTTTEYIYFSLNASPALSDITANVDVALFRFKTLICLGDVRMYRNIADTEGPADKPKFNSGNSANISGAAGGLEDTYSGNYGGPAYCPAPDLVTTIGQPSPSPVAGQPSSIPVTVQNIGTGSTTGPITTVVQIPSGTTFGTFPTNNNGWSCTTSGATATCTNSGTLAPGVSTSLQVPFIPTNAQVGTPLTVPPAKVGGGGEPPRNSTNNDSNQIITPLVVTNGAPDLTTTITAPTTGLPNVPFDYTVQISNIGTQAASGSVTETINLPAGITFNSGGGNGFVCTPATGPSAGPLTITCTNPAPVILAGDKTSFPINVTPTTTGSLTTTGNVSGGQDGNLTNNNAPSNTIQIGCGINAGVLSKN